MTNKNLSEWITPDSLVLLESWAREGLTDEDIAEKIGITVRTFYRWQKYTVTNANGEITQPIKEALKKGKELPDAKVEQSLLNKALSGDVTAMKKKKKNRRPDKWRDKPEALSGEEREPVRIIFDV